MAAVATRTAQITFHSRDFCILYPERSECVHEVMPLLFRIPLLFSSFEGEAMLGLGDVVLPGLLLSFALRYDYCKGNPISRNYFMALSIAYAVSLLLANIMAVLLQAIVAGQPALMYIVPGMLFPLMAFAQYKEEWNDLWKGPECF